LAKQRKGYQCLIHCDDVALEDDASLETPTDECNHDRNVCDDGLKEHFESAIDRGRSDELVCPDPECKKPVNRSLLKRLVSKDLMKVYVIHFWLIFASLLTRCSYNKKRAQEAAEKNSRFRWCTCGNGQIHNMDGGIANQSFRNILTFEM
jgi:hypothetical protein